LTFCCCLLELAGLFSSPFSSFLYCLLFPLVARLLFLGSFFFPSLLFCSRCAATVCALIFPALSCSIFRCDSLYVGTVCVGAILPPSVRNKFSLRSYFSVCFCFKLLCNAVLPLSVNGKEEEKRIQPRLFVYLRETVMSARTSNSFVVGGRPSSHFATPTRRRSPFTAADAELSAITASCADREHGFVGRAGSGGGARYRGCIATNCCTPVQAKEGMADSSVGRLAVSPRRGVCLGATFADMEVFCGSPRVHLALPPSGRRQSTERSHWSECSGSLVLYDCLVADGQLKGAASPHCAGQRSTTRRKVSTPSAAITPTEHCGESVRSKCPFLCTASETLVVEEAGSPHKNVRPPSSPSFSFFSAVAEKHNSRVATAVANSGTSDPSQQQQQRSAVSPRSVGLRSRQSPCSDAAAASLSSSAFTNEVKVFSPLRFDTYGVPSAQSQGLSSLSQSHPSSATLLQPHFFAAQWHSEDDKDLTSAGESTSQDDVLDSVKQQRLLHACLLSLTHENAALAAEVQRLRWCRRISVLRLAVRVLLQLPLRILAQCFRVLMSEMRAFVIPARPSLVPVASSEGDQPTVATA
jgi:hypothetical protein